LALGANHQRLESLFIRAEREVASGFLFLVFGFCCVHARRVISFIRPQPGTTVLFFLPLWSR
jgi:hypothetical protein